MITLLDSQFGFIICRAERLGLHTPVMFGKIFALDDIRFKHCKLSIYGETGTRLINELVLEYMQFFLCIHFITNPTEGDRGKEPEFVS